MKITKLTLGLLLSFALFNGCSNSDPFIEPEQEKKSNTDDFSAKHNPVVGLPFNHVYMKVEYANSISEYDKNILRNYYLIQDEYLSYTYCSPNSDIWIVHDSAFSEATRPKSTEMHGEDDITAVEISEENVPKCD